MTTTAEQFALVLKRLNDLAAPAPSKRFYGIDAASGYSGLSAKTLRRMIASGRLTAFRPVPGKLLIDRRELDAVILASTRPPTNGRGAGLAKWREEVQP